MYVIEQLLKCQAISFMYIGHENSYNYNSFIYISSDKQKFYIF